ncbi:MAG: hypothetical protein R3B49_10480 [Phycisphaerales bacterium]
MDAEIAVTFDQRSEDFAAAAAEGVDRPAWDDEVRRLKDTAFTKLFDRIVVGAGVGVLCVEPLVWVGVEAFQAAVARLIAMAIGGVFCGWREFRNYRRVRSRATIREQLVRDTINATPPSADERVTVRVSPAGLELRGESRTTAWAWPAIWRLDEFTRWDVITTYDYRSILVPKAAHPDEDHRRRFLGLLGHHRKAAGADETVITAWLRGHDLACANCKYALRGTRGAICPECGTPVAFDRVRQAHAMAIFASEPARAARR